MQDAKELIPWAVTDISIRPHEDMWSMNPSIHFDGSTWRCVMRCTDYAMPGGRTIRSIKSRPAGNQTKNAMVILDPQSWKPIQVYKMHERDGYPRVPCANIGYEDMRIFKTDRGGFQGVAASLHLDRGGKSADGGPHNQPPEQVLLSFDGEYNIVSARPIRGDWWSGKPQKNWVPFDHAAEPRFLYAINRGTMFDDRGALPDDAAVAAPSTSTFARPASPSSSSVPPPSPAADYQERERQERQERQEREARERQEREEHDRRERENRERREREDRERQERERAKADRSKVIRGSSNVQMVRGKRVVADTLSTRPSLARRGGAVRGGGDTRMMGTGRVLLPRYEGLRGGTQLSRVGDDAWLGIGHEMRFDKGLKYYWHVFYLVNSRGKMTSASPPMKLASNGIEFAAGMGIDGERVVVSFGVDDMECRVGETKLSAVLEMLRPV